MPLGCAETLCFTTCGAGCGADEPSALRHVIPSCRKATMGPKRSGETTRGVLVEDDGYPSCTLATALQRQWLDGGCQVDVNPWWFSVGWWRGIRRAGKGGMGKRIAESGREERKNRFAGNRRRGDFLDQYKGRRPHRPSSHAAGQIAKNGTGASAERHGMPATSVPAGMIPVAFGAKPTPRRLGV